MIISSFGGGTNSTAMLIGMVERGEKCDLILFADTGGEKPHTYQHIAEFSVWLLAHGMPAIQSVKGQQPQQLIDGSLEQECLRRNSLPSIAFGFKTCSQKWKRQPIEATLKRMGITPATMLIGFDADEPQRAKEIAGNRYPLIEWDWGRDECIEAIDRAGVSRPGKSACFFCPSSRKPEIMELRRMYPDLAARAIAMEEGAQLTSVKGLGRRFAWKDLYQADDNQAKLIAESGVEIDCGCYDGSPA